MKILGIESSCDDTSISIIDSNKNILVNETISQNKIHKDYNGVVPELAARNHVLFIDKILKRILVKQKLRITDIGLIAATVGPGLVGGLLVGLTFAKTLSQVNKIPFIGVKAPLPTACIGKDVSASFDFKCDKKGLSFKLPYFKFDWDFPGLSLGRGDKKVTLGNK